MSIQKDGFKTLITFEADATVAIEEKQVTPPGISAGGEIDTTTMRNTAWRTRQPKKLKTLSNASAVVAYDPASYTAILAMVGINQQITVTFPDGETLVFWGWIDEFQPGESTEGEQPTATITIIPSNQDDLGAEVAPALTVGP